MVGDRARREGRAQRPPGRVDGRRETGAIGEAHAAALLEARGCRVIDRNWRCRAGELDLVVLDPAGRLRFVEVRTRTGAGFGSPAESVTLDKRRRLRRLATQWLSEHPSGWRQVCFDVVGVDLADLDRPLLELFEEVM